MFNFQNSIELKRSGMKWLEKCALRQVCDKNFLFDQTLETKRALIWKMEYDSAEDKREVVCFLSKEEVNQCLSK